MPQLIVVGFKQDMHRASEVLNELCELKDDRLAELHDAVAVYRRYDGKLRIDQSFLSTGWGLVCGALVGALIPIAAGASGAVLAGTLVAGAVGGGVLGAAGGGLDADWWKSEPGMSAEFAKRASAMVQPGDSAIIALLSTVDPSLVAQCRDYGGEALQTTLTEDQANKVQAILTDTDRQLNKAK